MGKYFRNSSDIRKPFLIFDFASCNCSTRNFLIYEENFILFFISVESHMLMSPLLKTLHSSAFTDRMLLPFPTLSLLLSILYLEISKHYTCLCYRVEQFLKQRRHEGVGFFELFMLCPKVYKRND
jgi:hypothetical protein